MTTLKQFYETNKTIIDSYECNYDLNIAIQIFSSVLTELQRPGYVITGKEGSEPEIIWNDDYNNANDCIIPTTDELNSIIKQLQTYKPIWLLRQKRDKLLKDSDIYMLPDFPLTQNPDNLKLIKEYRQTLRNLPDNDLTGITVDNYETYLPTFPI